MFSILRVYALCDRKIFWTTALVILGLIPVIMNLVWYTSSRRCQQHLTKGICKHCILIALNYHYYEAPFNLCVQVLPENYLKTLYAWVYLSYPLPCPKSKKLKEVFCICRCMPPFYSALSTGNKTATPSHISMPSICHCRGWRRPGCDLVQNVPDVARNAESPNRGFALKFSTQGWWGSFVAVWNETDLF